MLLRGALHLRGLTAVVVAREVEGGGAEASAVSQNQNSNAVVGQS